MSGNGKCTVVQHYGPDVDHLRAVIPKKVVRQASLTKGTVLNWDILDDHTLVAKVVV